jgi:small subunit ribosomal protein S17
MSADTKKTEKKERAPKKTTAPRAAAETKTAAAGTVERNPLQKRRIVTGVVVSDKMQKTIVVQVDRRVRETLYKKYVTRSRRFKAHDEKNSAKVGDLVTLVESRPLSREKRWVLQNIVRRAGMLPDAGV